MALKSFFKITNPNKPNLLISGSSASLNDLLLADYLAQPTFVGYERITLDLELEPLDELIATLAESSLFSTQKIIVVKNPLFLTGKLTSFKQHELTELENIFAQIDTLDHVVVLKADVAKLDQRRKLLKLVKQHFQVMLTDFKPFVLPQLVDELVGEHDFTIEPTAKKRVAESLQQPN